MENIAVTSPHIFSYYERNKKKILEADYNIERGKITVMEKFSSRGTLFPRNLYYDDKFLNIFLICLFSLSSLHQGLREISYRKRSKRGSLMRIGDGILRGLQ